MRAAPIPDNEVERLEALRAGFCAYAPREERFDRITRTAKRLLQVPIALISIVEHDEQWFRSVQGLEVDHMPRDISFCGHAVALNRPFYIPDALQDPDFSDNPLVTGPPGIRSYLGWPLEIAPGVPVGSLCVIDTMPRIFVIDEWDALEDLACMAEAELKLAAMGNLQDKLVMQMSSLQRKDALDPLTGCWNIRGFRKLLTLGVEEARIAGTDLAVCVFHVEDFESLEATAGAANREAVTLVLAQVLRQRLPKGGALARLGPGNFCALIPASSAAALEDSLVRLRYPKDTLRLPDSQLRMKFSLAVKISWLTEMGPTVTAQTLWAHALTATGG